MKKLIFVVFLTGCSFAGTGTGNPKNSNAQYGEPDATKLMQLIDKTCRQISSCHPTADLYECYDRVDAMAEYAPKLGATETPAPTLSQLVSADEAGTRIADQTAIAACQTEVEALSCSDPAMQSAFDSNLTNPFANSAEILGPDCVHVFGP